MMLGVKNLYLEVVSYGMNVTTGVERGGSGIRTLLA